MAKKKLKVGLIGTGDIARDRHLPYWKELQAEGRVEVVAICDLIKERVEKNAETFAVDKTYVRSSRMLKENDFDIIDVCTQNKGHCPLAVAALEAGANVIVEKPMAMNVKESQLMIKTAKKMKRKLMVAQHMRFEAHSERLKEQILDGRLGDIYHANACMLRRRGIPGWGKFHIKRESLGGPLIDIGVHVMDLAVWLMGCPKPIAASGKVYRMFGDREDLENGEWGMPYPPKEFDVEDYATALVRFENNITMTVEVSWAANIAKDHEAVYILGDKAGITTSPPGIYSSIPGALTSENYDWLPEQEGHRMEIRHFTECVEKNRQVRVKPEESLRIQQIIDAIYESSKKNCEIKIR